MTTATAIGSYDRVAAIDRWVELGVCDRPAPQLTHYAAIRLTNGRTVQCYLSADEWQQVQQAELRYEVTLLNDIR